MLILEYFFAALGACLVAFLGFMALAGVTHYDLFPWPYTIFLGLAFAYTAFRAWLDRRVAPGRKFPTVAERVAIGAFVCFAIAGVWMGRPRPVPRMVRSTACIGHTITAASPATMMDLFMDAHQYLLDHGFKPTSQPLVGDVQVTYLTPNVTGINYIGSHGGSAPFVIQLEIHRDDHRLVATVGQEGATEEKYEAQAKATKAFLDDFEKMLNEGETTRQRAQAQAQANTEEKTPQATAGAALPTPDPTEMQITVHKDNIDVDGAIMPVASLKNELIKRLAKNRNLLVTVISEPDTNVAITGDVTKICNELKVKDITFAYADGD